MPALSSAQRKTLETTVVKARDLAERGARDALTALAVPASEPFPTMGDDDRKLRNRLRAHARQLGDQRDPQKGTQGIERLVREMAYEHWHRMLFARFLAENQLLIEPTSGVSVSLDECEELATEAGTELWVMAAQFAQAMLPQIFRVDDPVLAAKLPLEIRLQMQGLLAGVEVEVFTASDSLGWTYQFWQSHEKESVNQRVKSGEKVGADELPPLTQLFTEEYMVEFLLDNTIGAWHARKRLTENPSLRSSESEKSLLDKLAIDGWRCNYLRLTQGSEGSWSPTAGNFEEWPNKARDLKCLDPCMGSGHFIVSIIDRLVALRSYEEELKPVDALRKVLDDNIFGLEIDPRCSQIAVFNVALYAWKRFGYISLELKNFACSGLSPNLPIDQWLSVSDGTNRMQGGLKQLYDIYLHAGERGSLLNPQNIEASVFSAGLLELEPVLEKIVDAEAGLEDSKEVALAARGMSAAIRIMNQSYELVATNPPYLGQLKQNLGLRSWIEDKFSDARSDLSMAIYSRMLDYCKRGGTAAAVIPGEIVYQKRLSDFRGRILRSYTLNFVALLGKGAFRTPLRVQPCLFSCTKSRAFNGSKFGFVEIAEKDTSGKAEQLKTTTLDLLDQAAQLGNPDHSIRIDEIEHLPLLSEFVSGLTGLTTGASDQFTRKFWEVPFLGSSWEPMQSSIDRVGMYSGFSMAILWENEKGKLANYADSVKHLNHVAQNWRRGKPSWGKDGVAVSKMGDMGQSPYFGSIYNANCCALIPNNPEDTAALWCFLESGKYAEEVRKINKALLVETKYLTKVPVDFDYWRGVASEELPDGLPLPYSNHPTQWIFHGHPKDSKHVLQVAVIRLLGYKWPAEYLESISPSTNARDSIALCSHLKEFTDQDGIVCLQAVRGERAGADRLRGLLAKVYGDEWCSAKERELILEAAVDAGSRKPAKTLEDWIRNHFFADHCKVFQSRPFIWHVWDGNANGFNALVNYHKLAGSEGVGKKTLESLAYSYLGDWIDRQQADDASGVDGAESRLVAAQQLQAELIKILDGEPPYDLFVRWKPLHQQPIGWNPDADDGIRVNIRPFVQASSRRPSSKSNQGVLRAKIPNLDWSKDRGKEPHRARDEYPWHWGYTESTGDNIYNFGAPCAECPHAGHDFDGIRWNDLHYTRAAKEAARALRRGGA